MALEQLEQPEPGYNLARVVHCLDRTSRYSTATSRALYKAIEELERLQAAQKTREESAASMDAELAKSPAELNEGQPEKHGENPASSGSGAFEDPENGVGRLPRQRHSLPAGRVVSKEGGLASFGSHRVEIRMAPFQVKLPKSR